MAKKPASIWIESYLQKKYGEVYFEIKTRRGTEAILNDVRFSAAFLLETVVSFEGKTKVFQFYDHTSGAWRTISDEMCKKLIMEYSLPASNASPELYPTKYAFYNNITNTSRSVGLREEEERPAAYAVVGVSNGAIALDTDVMVKSGESVESTTHDVGKSPAHFIQHVLPVCYDATKTHPARFVRFLQEMMSDDDIELLRLWSGMVLLGKNYFHKILIITGEANSGKTVLIDIIERMVGRDNVATLNTSRLEERFELSEFFGKTLLVGKDVGSDFLQNKSAHMLKSLSGDSGLKAEVKHVQQRVVLGGPFNIVMVANSELPLELHGDWAAWERRLLVIKVKRKRPIERRIHDLDAQLVRDEGAAILNWMLRGAKEILKLRRARSDFPRSSSQVAAVSQLLGRSSPIREFVETCLVRAKLTDEVTSDLLYSSYLNYCARNDAEPAPQTVFQKRIGRPLYEVHGAESTIIKGRGGLSAKRGYRGVMIIGEEKADASASQNTLSNG